MVRLGKMLFRVRNWLFPLFWLGILVGFEPMLFLGDPDWARFAEFVGWVVLLLGLGIRFSVIGLVNIPREGKKRVVNAKSLVTEGIFRQVRNPLYVGNLVIFLGWLLIFHNPWAYLVGLPLVALAYQAIIRAEEAFMVDRFGEEFRRYIRKANRWLPRFRGLGQSLKGQTFNWGRAMAKEYNAISLWLTMGLIAMAYKRLVHPELPLTAGFALGTGLVLGMVIGLSAFIILLKRQKILSGNGWKTQAGQG